MSYCKHCKQDLLIGGTPHLCAEGNTVVNNTEQATPPATTDCSELAYCVALVMTHSTLSDQGIVLRQELIATTDSEAATEIAAASAREDNPDWEVQCTTVLCVN